MFKVLKVFNEHKVHREQSERRVFKVFRVLRVYREQSVFRVLKVFKAHRVHRDIKVLLVTYMHHLLQTLLPSSEQVH